MTDSTPDSPNPVLRTSSNLRAKLLCPKATPSLTDDTVRPELRRPLVASASHDADGARLGVGAGASRGADLKDRSHLGLAAPTGFGFDIRRSELGVNGSKSAVGGALCSFF